MKGARGPAPTVAQRGSEAQEDLAAGGYTARELERESVNALEYTRYGGGRPRLTSRRDDAACVEAGCELSERGRAFNLQLGGARLRLEPDDRARRNLVNSYVVRA